MFIQWLLSCSCIVFAYLVGGQVGMGVTLYLKGYAICRQPLLAPRGCHFEGLVPPFSHPWGTFWHLGSTLGTIGAAGWTRGYPEQNVH